MLSKRDKLPLISIITPSYNQGCFINEAILSVLNQDYPNIEYIVIDGGSTDNTIDILKKYGNKIKWISEPDRGQSDAINKGFKIASGEIISWLNSDDSYMPNIFKKVVEYFEKNPEVMMIYGDGYEIDNNGNIIDKFNATQEFDLWKLIYVWDYILQPTVFIRKEILNEVGLLDINLNWCMDWDFWIRIGKKYTIDYVKEYIANSRIYSATKTSTGGLKRFREIVQLMRKHGDSKYPPGYFIYGVDTVDNIIKTKFNFIYFILRYPLLLLRYLSSILLFWSQGIYEDGWVIKKSRYLLLVRRNTKRACLVLKGLAIFPIEIKIMLCDRIIERIKIKSAGDFVYKIDISSCVTKSGIIKIEIISNKTRRLSEEDPRKVAFMLKKLKIEC